MATPGRASFAGLANQARQSPSFRDIARLIVPNDREKAFKHAMTNAVALLIVVFILATLYAVSVVLMPFFRPLLLALLFGSFLHPLKRSLSVFFKQILSDIRDNEMPVLVGIMLPITMINRAMDWVQINFCLYFNKIIKFARTLIKGDLKSILSVCSAAMSLAIIGGDSLMNFVMCFNLIIFITDITKTDTSFSDCYLHFLIRSFGLAQFCWFHTQIVYLVVPIILLWMGLSWLLTKLKQKFYPREVTKEDGEQESEQDLDDENLMIGNKYKLILSRYYSMMIDQLESYVDTISSACVIGLVAFIVIFTTLYLSFEIYTESAYLIEKVSNSANTIINNNPDLKSLLPDGLTGVQSLIDGAIKNTYQHGRVWIRKSTRQLLNEAAMDDFNTTQSSLIEKQIIEFWDRAYGLWINNRSNVTANHNSSLDMSTSLRGGQKPYDWNRLNDALHSLDMTLCAQIFKQNWDTVISVSDSVMKVLKGNLSLIIGLLTTTLSLIVIGGNVLLNFVIDLIIFSTALFYLLCASDDQYKPIKMIKNLIPLQEPSLMMKARGQLHRSEFINSVDESIHAVFTASLKMMVFHGLSTWLLHILFELQVIYIPAVISALFGAIPFISPYWASIPACLDLWLSGHVSQAALMMILATVPSSFATTAFYSEIKGAGHPYLTALAIAGGVFVFGIEGALFGPMLLVSIRLLWLIIIYFMDVYK